VAELIRGLDARRVADNLARVREELGRDDVQVLAAVKYLAAEELGALAQAGITVVGENRAQELEVKAAAHPELTWDFIGHLQSRKVKQVLPHARLIHSVGSESVIRALGKATAAAAPGAPRPRVLVEVNIAGEEGKSGIAPDALEEFVGRTRQEGGADVVGLMTMPPLAESAEDSRRWFAALAELAAAHGLPELSMGTTQDFGVAVEEGATIVRIGTKLYR
jgi:pyridoxal phosphate enzyme (YggS family)